ncbi:MAG: dihydroxyacetone kinase subunit DhaL, partial [Clostridium sp.]
MAGASVSIMKLDEELKGLLSAESDTPAFKVNGHVQFVEYTHLEVANELDTTCFEVETKEEYSNIVDEKITLDNMLYIVDKMSQVIIENEVSFCELDSFAGDGDFGMSVAKGFKQLKREWKEIISEDNLNIGKFLDSCSMVIMEHCGGASGPIWGSAFRAASKEIGNKKELSVKDFAKMLQASVKGIQSTGERSFGRGAVVGDKTLIDALVPCADAWINSANENKRFKGAFEKGAAEAVKGAKTTEEIVARMGRAGTVGDRSLGHPDAGAHGLGVIFTYISDSIK